MYYSNQFARGVTLIEALLVLGIMAILIGMVMTFYAMTTEKTKNNQLIQEADKLIFITRQLSESQQNFTGFNGQVMAKTGYVENRYINKNGDLIDPYGGKIDVIPFNYQKNGIPIYLAFNFYGLSKTACVLLGTQDFGGEAQSMTVTNMREDSPDGFKPIIVVMNCDNSNDNYVNIRLQQ
ncbi:type II secretion system protein [Neokomagataea anthophila]|uniref:Type II secretion system protein n=1 Tax=Neokomagataea anthophila TaxID=2826925 RepID=A0ABS5E756_9PROT|nr:type II secretion system protein [Neokomagataea anthophila]MBR0559742.1 type II secretion system protein [Neokomagataea anthophila]